MTARKFISPIAIYIPRVTKKDRRVALNLNVYRNLHYIINNNIKQIYNQIMKEQMQGLKISTPIDLQFELYKENNRTTDRTNILCIVEKFFCDALVEHGCIPDDSDEYINSSYYTSGSIDKNNPRVEIWIREISH